MARLQGKAAGLLLLALALVATTKADEQPNLLEGLKHQIENLMELFSTESAANRDEPEQLHPLDHFLLDIVPTFFNQRPNNENGTESQFRDYIMSDDSNDDAWRLTGVSIIFSSGKLGPNMRPRLTPSCEDPNH